MLKSVRFYPALLTLVCAATLLANVGVAEAKPARCFTTDEGRFPCQFRATDSDGSFKITARGKPTYILNIVGRDVAEGFVTVGKHNVSLPGHYRRSDTDRACWVNDSTSAKICAR
ncbi:MAG: hypothetical protein JWO68_4055 [Actinomycetia bacterium]|jgi:hypothetical protein|nr:hypothetical protein [Actinomycetes bacterium]